MTDTRSTWHWKLYRCSPLVLVACMMAGFAIHPYGIAVGWIVGAIEWMWATSNYQRHRERVTTPPISVDR